MDELLKTSSPSRSTPLRPTILTVDDAKAVRLLTQRALAAFDCELSGRVTYSHDKRTSSELHGRRIRLRGSQVARQRHEQGLPRGAHPRVFLPD